MFCCNNSITVETSAVVFPIVDQMLNRKPHFYNSPIHLFLIKSIHLNLPSALTTVFCLL